MRNVDVLLKGNVRKEMREPVSPTMKAMRERLNEQEEGKQNGSSKQNGHAGTMCYVCY